MRLMSCEAGLVETQRTRTRDGAELEIRQVRPDDKRLIADGHGATQPREPLPALLPAARSPLGARPRLPDRDRPPGPRGAGRDRPGDAATWWAWPATCAAPSPTWPRSRSSSAIPGSVAASPPRLLERLVERAREAADHALRRPGHGRERRGDQAVRALVPGHARPRRSASGHLELVDRAAGAGPASGSTLARVLRVVAHGAVAVNPYRATRDAIRRAAKRRAHLTASALIRPVR